MESIIHTVIECSLCATYASLQQARRQYYKLYCQIVWLSCVIRLGAPSRIGTKGQACQVSGKVDDSLAHKCSTG